MIKKFFKDTSALTLVNVLTQATALITFPIYSRYLRVEDYGLHDYLVLIGVLTGVLVTLEGHQALIRLLHGRDSEEGRRLLVSSVLGFSVAVTGVLGAAVAVIGFVRDGELFGVVCQPEVLAAAVLSWFLALIKQQMIAMHRAMLTTHLIAYSALGAFVLQVSVGISTIVVFKLGVIGLFLGAAAGSMVQLSVLWWAKRELVGLRIYGADLKEAFRFSLPLAISALGTIGWVYTDRYIAKHYLGLHEVGLLGVSYRFAGVVGVFTGAMGMALSPLIYANHEKRREQVAEEVGVLFHGFVVFAAIAITGFAGYAHLVLGWLAPAAYLPAAPYFSLVAAALLLGAGYPFFPGLMLAKKTAVFATIQLSGLVVNIGLSVALVKVSGVLGVCVASVITATCVLVAIGIAGNRYFSVRVQFWKILIVGAVALGCVAGLYPAPSSQSALFGFVAPILVAGVAYALRLVRFAPQGKSDR